VLSGLINDRPDGKLADLDDYHLINEQSIHEALIYLYIIFSQMRIGHHYRADPPCNSPGYARSDLPNCAW
jgi:hypothetical protein